MKNKRKALLNAILEGAPVETISGLSRHVLRSIVAGEIDFDPRAQPLGFTKAIVFENGLHSLRIHHWSAIKRSIQSNELLIHDHFFNFRSYVFSGKLTNVNYNIVEDSMATPSHQLFGVSYDDDGSVLVPQKTGVRVEEIERVLYESGCLYDLPCDTYHETIVESNEAAVSFVATTKVREKNAYVVGPYLKSNELRFSRDEVSRKQVIAELSLILK